MDHSLLTTHSVLAPNSAIGTILVNRAKTSSRKSTDSTIEGSTKPSSRRCMCQKEKNTSPFDLNRMKLLGKKERAVLEYILDYQSSHGDHPTYREIQTRFSYNSINSVSQFIDGLVKKDFLFRVPKRGYRLITFKWNTHQAKSSPNSGSQQKGSTSLKTRSRNASESFVWTTSLKSSETKEQPLKGLRDQPETPRPSSRNDSKIFLTGFPLINSANQNKMSKFLSPCHLQPVRFSPREVPTGYYQGEVILRVQKSWGVCTSCNEEVVPYLSEYDE